MVCVGLTAETMGIRVKRRGGRGGRTAEVEEVRAGEDCVRGVGEAFHRQSAGHHRGGDLTPDKLTHHTPEPDAGSEFEHGFGGEVTDAPRRVGRALDKACFWPFPLKSIICNAKFIIIYCKIHHFKYKSLPVDGSPSGMDGSLPSSKLITKLIAILDSGSR